MLPIHFFVALLPVLLQASQVQIRKGEVGIWEAVRGCGGPML